MSASSRGLWKATFGQVAQTLRLLEDLGITPGDLKRLRRDRPFARRLVAFWKAGAVTGDPIPDTESQARARSIMGKNFLGLEEVRRGFGLALPVEQLAEVPFSEETLRDCKDTHVLVAGAPLSMSEMCILTGGNVEPFADEKKVGVRWYLLRKEPVPESLAKSYDQQCSLLTEEEEVPFACEMIYMVILYRLTHRERLLLDFCLRFQDKDPDGDRLVFTQDSYGFYVNPIFWDGARDDHLGLASARKC